MMNHSVFGGLQHLASPQIHSMPQSGNVYGRCLLRRKAFSTIRFSGDTVLTKPTLGDRRSVKKKRNENRLTYSRSHMFSMSCAEYLCLL